MASPAQKSETQKKSQMKSSVNMMNVEGTTDMIICVTTKTPMQLLTKAASPTGHKGLQTQLKKMSLQLITRYG